jgi:hypothetical protein
VLHQPVVAPETEELFKVRVRDKDRYWTFKVAASELKAIREGKLFLYWCRGWKHIDIEKQSEQALIKEWYGPKNIFSSRRLKWSKKAKDVDLQLEPKIGRLKQLVDAGTPLKLIKKEEKEFRKKLKKLRRKSGRAMLHREWCLVTRTQREILLSGVNYDEEARKLFGEGGSSAWSEWSSIRWAKSQTWREYKRVKRTPILSLKKR